MSSNHKINDRPRNRAVGKAMAAMPDITNNSKLGKGGQSRWHDFVDSWFRDANGQIVIAQVPNVPLTVFIVTSLFGSLAYHGFWQTAARIVAMVSITVWSILEIRGGVNRFRRLLGKVILACTVLTLVMYFWK